MAPARRSAVCVITAATLLAAAGSATARQAEPQTNQQPEPAATQVESPQSSTTATADLPKALETKPSLRFEANAWIWVIALSGDIGVKGRTADVDLSFKDIVDESDSLFAFSGRVEFGIGRWGAFIDGLYADIGAKEQGGPRGGIKIDLTFEYTLIDFGAMYRLGDWEPTGDAAKNPCNTTLDLYAGARYTNLDVEFDPARISSRTESKDWIDPIFGAKLVLPLSERWRLQVNGDIGGFGVASDFTWSATAVFAYSFLIFDHPAAVFAGYRAIGDDYTDGDGNDKFTWDVIVHGPLLGFALHF